MEISRLSSRVSLVCERENLILDIRSLTFSQWRDLRGVI